MNKQEIKNKVAEILITMGYINANSRLSDLKELVEDLEMEFTGILTMCEELEETFSISISDDEMASFEAVGNVVDCIHGKL